MSLRNAIRNVAENEKQVAVKKLSPPPISVKRPFGTTLPNVQISLPCQTTTPTLFDIKKCLNPTNELKVSLSIAPIKV